MTDHPVAKPSDSSEATTMPTPTKAFPPLTLVLAATPSLGIGQGGTLPWPQLKKEMGYFARVTKRVSEGGRRINAVVMGRKTWDSIPEKFRPLKGRLNVVITRTPEELSRSLGMKGGGDKEVEVEGPIVAESVMAALERLRAFDHTAEEEREEESRGKIHRVFVIGGASVYHAALELPQAERVLLTKIKKEYDCDTFFGVDLDREGSGWVRRSRGELEEWTGESVQEGGLEQEGVGFEFGMYERVR